MAIARKAQVTNLNASTSSTSNVASASIAIGDAVVVIAGCYSASGTTPTSCVDSGGNSYSLKVSYTAAGPKVWIYTCIATAAATSVTVSYASGYRRGLIVATYTGVASIGSNTNTGHVQANAETITETLASATNYAVAGLIHQSISTPTQSSGTLLASISDTSNSVLSCSDNTGSTSVTCSDTYSPTAYESAAVVELVAATTGNATATPTGAVTTSAIGTPTTTADGSLTSPGAECDSSAGTVTATGVSSVDATAAPTGIADTSAAGSLTATVSVSASITGTSSSSTAAAPGYAAAANVAAPSSLATSAAGTVTAQAGSGVIASPSGAVVTSSQGALTLSAGQTIIPSGQAANSAAGSVTASSGNSVIATPSGALTGSVPGSPLGSVTVLISLAGLQMTSSAGPAIAGVSVSPTLTGKSVLSGYGSPALKGDANRSPPSVVATNAANQPSATGIALVALSGAAIQSSHGTLTAISIPIPPEPIRVRLLAPQPVIHPQVSIQLAIKAELE